MPYICRKEGGEPRAFEELGKNNVFFSLYLSAFSFTFSVNESAYLKLSLKLRSGTQSQIRKPGLVSGACHPAQLLLDLRRLPLPLAQSPSQINSGCRVLPS